MGSLKCLGEMASDVTLWSVNLEPWVAAPLQLTYMCHLVFDRGPAGGGWLVQGMSVCQHHPRAAHCTSSAVVCRQRQQEGYCVTQGYFLLFF